jgi:uncharacterized protein YuzB (UPF0349 family)
MNEFKTCNKCTGFNSEELINKLKLLDSNAKIMVGCQNMCAIGAKKPFVIVNGVLMVADTIDEVIEKVKEVI